MKFAITHVFGVDQGQRASGWGLQALDKPRQYVAHGVARNAKQRRSVLDLIETLCPLSSLLVVLEDHGGMPVTRKAHWARNPVTGEAEGPQRSTRSLLGMGGARDRWREQLELRDFDEAQLLLVEPKVWRKMLGTRVNITTEAWKAQAVMWASAESGEHITDHNEAEGMCMTSWGAVDGVRRLYARSA